MRIIDVYRKNSASDSGFSLVAQDLIQVGSADVSRKMNGKSFTMADGSLTFYRAENDAVQMSLEFECTAEQAKNLSEAVRYGQLFFAGMRAGVHTSKTPTDAVYLEWGIEEMNAFSCYLTENTTVNVQEISAKSDIYTVRISPLRIEISEGVPELYEIPAIRLYDFLLDGNREQVTPSRNYTYKNGIFYRNQVIFTDSENFSVSFKADAEPKENAEIQPVLKAVIQKNGSEVLNWDSVLSAEFSTGELALSDGDNTFDLILFTENKYYKRLCFRFSVWKQPAKI